MDRVLQAYGVTRPRRLSDTPLVIDRKPFMFHPRNNPNKPIDRSTANLATLVPGARVVQLEALPFRRQLELIVSTRYLYGIHGAGLTHLIWMSPGSSVTEWVVKSHRDVRLFAHIGTWVPWVAYSRTPLPSRPIAPPPAASASSLAAAAAAYAAAAAAGDHGRGLTRDRGRGRGSEEEPRLAVIVPFRDDAGNDPLAQGIGRWRNLQEFVPYMSDWLSRAGRNFKIIVVEQSPEKTWNKGALFNAGITMNPDFDYYALHDVDQVPINPQNTYAIPGARPKHLCVSTKQNANFNYDVVGGVLLITRQQYLAVNGYSNKFKGWGAEDQDMAHRIRRALGGFDRPPPSFGRYRALDHTRVKGLDETEQFKQNHKVLKDTMAKGDLSAGLSTVKFKHIRTSEKFGATIQTVELGPGM